MPRRITGTFQSREEAETVRQRLLEAGIAQDQIMLTEPVEEPGSFDRLVNFLLSSPSDGSGQAYRLTAQVDEERADQAWLLLGKSPSLSAPRAQLFEFPELREEMRIRKQPAVREEMVLRREVEETVADIEGTLRHTEVEVEDIPPSREPLRFGLR